MTRNNINTAILAILTVFMFSITYPAEMNAQYELRRSVIACGAVSAEGGGHAVRGTLGQHVVGTARTELHAGFFGFWYDAENVVVEVEHIPAARPDGFTITAPFPNPAVSQVSCEFQLPASGPVRISLYNALGRRIHRVEESSRLEGRHILTLPLANLIPGYYVLRIEWKGHARSVPVMVLH